MTGSPLRGYIVHKRFREQIRLDTTAVIDLFESNYIAKAWAQ